MNIWLERLTSLHKSQLRLASANEGIQTVHLEILQYLSICNDYSNTAQALSEYLGQTKGSISQSIKVMEKLALIKRVVSTKDKRVFKLKITAKGKSCLKRVSKNMFSLGSYNQDDEKIIISLLRSWQAANNKNGFGQCISCKYNMQSTAERFKCGLTGDTLKKSNTLELCREHEFKAVNYN